MADADRLILLDACCMINVYASGRVGEILSALPSRAAIVERAAAESLYVRRGGTGADADEREPMNLSEVCAAGVLEVLRIETDEELQAFVDYAVSLDDGEAMTLAVAEKRGHAVATDDRRARRAIQEGGAAPIRYSTVDLVRFWAEASGACPGIVREVIRAIEQRARWRPRAEDVADHDWWQAQRDVTR